MVSLPLRIVRPEDALPIAGGRPLSLSLERQLLALLARPSPYRIEALADPDYRPESLDDVVSAMSADVDEDELASGAIRGPLGELLGTRVRVWTGASHRTIWSRPAVNWLFRAWHDHLHVLTCSGFDPTGEARVAVAHVAAIEGRAEREILLAETIGQVRYFERRGAFPDRQRDFVRDCVRFGLPSALERDYRDRPGPETSL